jgi:hypothetical protein
MPAVDPAKLQKPLQLGGRTCREVRACGRPRQAAVVKPKALW